MYYLERKRIESEIERVHQRFIHIMYPKFGLSEEPKPSISFRGYGALGYKKEFESINPQFKEWLEAQPPQLTHEISVGEISDYAEISEQKQKLKDACLHESSHYLHIIKNPRLFIEKRKNNKSPLHIYNDTNSGTRLVELIAELGVIIFLNTEGNLKYYLDRMTNRGYTETQFAYNIFRKGINLEQLASYNLEEGSLIANELWK